MFRHKFCIVLLVLLHISDIWSAVARNESLILSRIKHGRDADIKEALFQVSIRTRAREIDRYGSGLRCGGSLISKNVVLTAAHCFYTDEQLTILGEAEDFLVVMGNLIYVQRDKNTLQFDIKKFVAASFNSENENDIALVFLDGEVPKKHPTTKPIALSKSLYFRHGLICQAYGWGIDGQGVHPIDLQVVDLPLIPGPNCRTLSDYGRLIHNGMLCAGNLEGGAGACKGDSGGPLVRGGIQIAIMSWGQKEGCGQPKRPSVLTNVALYKTWIEKHIKLNGGAKATFKKV